MDGAFDALPLPGSSPEQYLEHVARATPSPHVRGRVAALAHFLAAFRAAFLLEGSGGSPTRFLIQSSFLRCHRLLEALLFNWPTCKHGEDRLALSRHLRSVRTRHDQASGMAHV
jgi:hypothetical protein